MRQSKQGGGPGITAVLVGNKCEFRDGSEESRAEVSKQEAQQLANQLGMQYFEASAVSFPSTKYVVVHGVISR